jgi:hypothetical protein
MRLAKENLEYKQKIETLAKELSKFDNVDISKYIKTQYCIYYKHNSCIVCHTCKLYNYCKKKDPMDRPFPNISF